MRKILSLCLAVLLIVAVGAPAVQATEYATVTVYIANNTDGVLEEDITVWFKGRGEVGTYMAYVTKEDSASGKPVIIQIERDRTYDISFEYESSYTGLFYICNADGSKVEAFHASGKNITVGFQVRCTEFNPTEPAPDTMDEEAPAVYEKYLQAAKTMDMNDSQYAPIKDVLEFNAVGFSKTFELTCGRPAEEWAEYSLWEQWMILSLWAIPQENFIFGKGYDHFFGSPERFKEHGAHMSFEFMRRCNTEVMKPFEEIMMWQYEYLVKHHKFYNFVQYIVDHKDEPEFTMPTVPETTAPKVEVTLPVTEPEETHPAHNEQTENIQPGENRWGGVIGGLKDNLVTVLLLIVAGAGWAYCIYLRKKKNIDDE